MPETFVTPTTPKAEGKKRGKLLTTWLVLMVIFNTGTALTYLLANSSIIASYPNAPSGIFYVYGILALANVVFTIFLFKWKKWAFWAFCGTTVISLLLNLIIGVAAFDIISGLLGPLVLYLILRSKWSFLE